jgi:hypothetical protein
MSYEQTDCVLGQPLLVTEKEGEMDLPSLVAGSSDAGEHDDEKKDPGCPLRGRRRDR